MKETITFSVSFLIVIICLLAHVVQIGGSESERNYKQKLIYQREQNPKELLGWTHPSEM